MYYFAGYALFVLNPYTQLALVYEIMLETLQQDMILACYRTDVQVIVVIWVYLQVIFIIELTPEYFRERET